MILLCMIRLLAILGDLMLFGVIVFGCYHFYGTNMIFVHLIMSFLCIGIWKGAGGFFTWKQVHWEQAKKNLGIK